MISILMLTHNAPKYVKITLETLKNKTKDIDYELIIWDNDSDKKTKKMLMNYYNKKRIIDRLVFSKQNLLFSKGNNSAFKLCNSKADYVLLLNSDIEIRNEDWLNYLLELCKKKKIGAVGYGVCENNPITRADGFCLLIKKDLYEKYLLDEDYEWWWSVTRLQARILKEGYKIIAIKNYENMLYHFGGKSGTDFKDASGMDVTATEVVKWFEKGTVTVLSETNK